MPSKTKVVVVLDRAGRIVSVEANQTGIEVMVALDKCAIPYTNECELPSAVAVGEFFDARVIAEAPWYGRPRTLRRDVTTQEYDAIVQAERF